MSASDDALRRIDTLVQVAMRIAASAPSGRFALAKVAQQLEREWLPPAYQETIWTELTAARNAAGEAIPFRDVERVLRDAWGGKPSDELDELDPEPLAVTPGSQVHRGVLEGEPVAVKVLRPGLAASVRQDLALLEGLLSPLGAAFPRLDTQAILREVRERVLDELDLEHEAGNQRRFHRALRAHPYLIVPAPVTRLAGDAVHVSALVEGTPLREADQAARDRAAAQLVVFVLGGLREGIVHADPDPDDVLITGDGRLAVVDYGATATVERDRADIDLAAVDAFLADDGDALGQALEQLGTLGAAHGATALRLGRHVLGEHAEPRPTRLDSEAIVAAERRLEQRLDEAVELLLAGTLPPGDLWPARGIAQLFGTVARVGATAPWSELVRAALRDGWDAEIG